MLIFSESLLNSRRYHVLKIEDREAETEKIALSSGSSSEYDGFVKHCCLELKFLALIYPIFLAVST